MTKISQGVKMGKRTTGLCFLRG